ncbi:MAG: Hpt domain-containing protein [Gammaproteobacteria bacterium]|nr:Hpt domain-containing protein [Gammaproteobacteria bacterium]
MSAPTPPDEGRIGALPAYDRARALEVTGGNETVADEFLAHLQRDLDAAREPLARALDAADYDALWEHAHRLRGGARYCGVPALEAALEALEHAISERETPRIGERLRILDREIARLTAECAPRG